MLSEHKNSAQSCLYSIISVKKYVLTTWERNMPKCLLERPLGSRIMNIFLYFTLSNYQGQKGLKSLIQPLQSPCLAPHQVTE